MRTAFHRTLHFDGLHSPLADDPEGFTEPLRKSTVAQALQSPRGTAAHRHGEGDPGRPTRLLIAVRKNDDFLHEIRDHFEAHPEFETRFVDVVELPDFERLVRSPAQVVEQLLRDDGKLVEAVDEILRPHLEWADVVFVEWCTVLAALVSRVDSHGARLVVRVHSYEAFTQWPQLTDFSRIHDVVFVSDHLRDLAGAAFPGLRGPLAPELHVIANAVDLQRCQRTKPDPARFTLGVVGAQKVVKDPRWAIEVLRRLREHDERYRLLLIRGWLHDDGPGTKEYAEALQRDLDELGPIGAVQRTEHVHDVPGALERVGVVISSSVRESFHIGFVEGVASGAVPVVRDWPFFPGSAQKLFPRDWVVADPDEAARRILALTSTDEAWREAGAEASEHALETWDWRRVSLAFDYLLGA
jgi:glycosyltransferase involved in cell wall biosynthesis